VKRDNPVRPADRRATFTSGQKIDWVGQLERPFRVAARQIALLVAHAEHDRVSLVGDLTPLGRLEVRGTRELSARCLEDHAGPLVSLIFEITFRRLAEVCRAASDEEHSHAECARLARERERGCNRFRLTERLEFPKAAWSLLEIASPVDDAGPSIDAIRG